MGLQDTYSENLPFPSLFGLAFLTQRTVAVLFIVFLFVGNAALFFWIFEEQTIIPPNVENQMKEGQNHYSNMSNNMMNSSSERWVRIHYFNPPDWTRADTFNKCSHKCFISFGKEYKYYSTSDFVVFDGSASLPQTPPPKPAGQVWIYHSLEPPFLQPRLHNWNGKVNWTFSYRRDADFTHVYGTMLFKEAKGTKRIRLHSNWENKRHGNAWFVSHENVPSRRDEFASRLNKIINVDIYSRKGPKKCPSNTIKDCDKLLNDTYKFYLSFENDFCRDYVTEKCFKIYASNVDVIPVVRGLSDYSIFAPPNSYIDTSKFNDIASLGEFQKDLSNNHTEFENYFQWRKFYYIQGTGDRALCRMCAQAHKASNHQRLYGNLDTWIRGDQNNPMCRDVTDIK